MADNKKYYYLKLKDNFFDTDEIIILESMQDGYLYSNILLKLYLRSLKTGGRLIRLVGENLIPYDIKSLATLTNTSIDTVTVAMEIFKKIGLVEILESGALYFPKLNGIIGVER